MDQFIDRQIDLYRIDALLGKSKIGAVQIAYSLNLAR